MFSLRFKSAPLRPKINFLVYMQSTMCKSLSCTSTITYYLQDETRGWYHHAVGTSDQTPFIRTTALDIHPELQWIALFQSKHEPERPSQSLELQLFQNLLQDIQTNVHRSSQLYLVWFELFCKERTDRI